MSDSLPDAAKRQTQFKKALAVIELHVRSIEQAEANADTIAALKAVLAYLRQVKEPVLAEIFSKIAPARKGSKVASRIEADDATITNMSLGKIEALVRDPSVLLSDLKRLAAVRFAFPPGVLSNLSRERLIQRLLDTMENEKTHETISRLAGKRDGPGKT